MAKERMGAANSKGNGKIIAGGILCAIGLPFLLLGIIFYIGAATSGEGELDRAFGMASAFAAFGAFGISCFFVLLGTILFFVGRSQGKKQRALHTADVSQSDYNKAIDK